MYLRYGDVGEEVTLLQRALNEKLNYRLKADGHFGKLTEEALRKFQSLNNFHVTGVYSQFEINLLSPFISAKYIRQKDLETIAEQENLPVSIVKALRKVEARNEGFLYDGRVIILFERHKFYRHLVRETGQLNADKNAAMNPSICNPEKGGYLGYEKEHLRLQNAINIHKEAALKSFSSGLFQILGSNFRECGYGTAEQFYSDQMVSEHNHAKAFFNFIKSNRALQAAVRQRNYVRIAELYNGPNQSTGEYAKKLAIADASFAS